MTGQTLNGTTVNGTKPRVPTFEGFRPLDLRVVHAADDQPRPEPQPTTTPAETFPMPEPAYDPIKHAEADRLRALGEAEAKAKLVEAEAAARAAEILAAEDAEKQRIANERAAMRLEKEKADHAAHLARKAKETAESNAAKEKTDKAAAAEEAKDAARAAEQQRSETWWKWGARGIYLVGLAIAAPVQFLDFWDPKRPFMVSAPILLEGLALVLAAGAAWAVAHRRDVMPYRIGIMLGAAIAATINMRGGLTNPAIGFNAGLIGAIASLGGPIVLMAYEHGIAQRADGIPSWRETRAADKKAAEIEAARDKARADREAAAAKTADEKAARDADAEAEQKRKDADRKAQHEDVWKIAEALRSARGLTVVTEQIWADAWYRVTGSKTVGVRPEMEAQSRAALERMKGALDGSLPQVESQMPHPSRRDPDAPDGRRFNGGTPPVRKPGESAPHSPIARRQAAITAAENTAREDA